jgi:dienelactone hydrolase
VACSPGLASTRLPIDAAVSYYGVQIDPHLGEADRLECPLLMHFAENDPHVPPQTVAAIQARLGGLSNVSIHIYPGTSTASIARDTRRTTRRPRLRRGSARSRISAVSCRRIAATRHVQSGRDA